MFSNIHLSIVSQSFTVWGSRGGDKGFYRVRFTFGGVSGKEVGKRKLQVENECVYAFKLLFPFKYQILWIRHI